MLVVVIEEKRTVSWPVNEGTETRASRLRKFLENRRINVFRNAINCTLGESKNIQYKGDRKIRIRTLVNDQLSKA